MELEHVTFALQGDYRRGWASEAELRSPLQHWHSAPYETLEGYRMELDAKRMKKDMQPPATFDVKADFSCLDPLTELQVSLQQLLFHCALPSQMFLLLRSSERSPSELCLD